MTNTDVPRFDWICGVPAIGGFLLAIGLMLFPPSFDNGVADPEPCGVPAFFDQREFTKKTYGSDVEIEDEMNSRSPAGCAAAVDAREHKAVGALAVATPLGLLAVTAQLYRRTTPAARAPRSGDETPS